MILNNFSQYPIHQDPLYESAEINDIVEDPFEYILSTSYECALMEAQINFSAICAEYEYLREYGVEAICEANIIVSIFTAIKNAIAACAKKIAQFFKSIIGAIGDKLKSLKNKITSFGESAKILRKYSDEVNSIEKTMIQYINRLNMTNNQSDNYQTFNHSIASLMNKLINTADSTIATACSRHCSLCIHVISSINHIFQKI